MARIRKYKIYDEAYPSTNMWRGGLYVRLSKEDGDKEDGDKFESDSITSQKLIQSDFCLENADITVVETYIDDGFSGTNLDRPAFKRMISDVRGGKINCIIVKDLSRFARNYVEAGQYLEVFFPVMNIRFISIIDDIDSFKNPSSVNNIGMAFKNVMNEEYSRDISNKVRSVLDIKRQNGEFIGAFPSYGFLKDSQNKNKLIIDPVASKYVKNIFQLFLEGTNIYQIALKLNELGVPSPSKYKKLSGMNYKSPYCKINDGLWTVTSVRGVLSNRIYCGDMVQGKKEKISHKIMKSRQIEEDKWLIVENTHEAIIDKEKFFTVQKLLKTDKRTSPNKSKLDLFAGLLKCPDCGRAMTKKTIYRKNKLEYYVCRTYESLSKTHCTRHSMRADRLKKVVLEVLSKQIKLAVEMTDLVEKINGNEYKSSATKRLEISLDNKENEKKKIQSLLLDLYPDWKSGFISKEQYLEHKNRNETELSQVENAIFDLKKTYEIEKNGVDNSNSFILNFSKHKKLNELTREILTTLVDVIFIHESGLVEISFKFQDSYLAALDYIEKNSDIIQVSLDKIIANFQPQEKAYSIKEA